MKMWSGRFRQPLDPEFEKWQRSFPYDQRLLPFELAASRAHANALEHAGVLSSEELSDIIQALGEIGRRAVSSPEFLNDPEAEDVHHFVEKQARHADRRHRIQTAHRAQSQRTDCD